MSVTFAVFFSYAGAVPPRELELLSTCSAQLRKIYPAARLVVLSDPATASVIQSLGYETYVGHVDVKTLLLDRLRLFRSILAESQLGSVVCLLDYDILILKTVDVFDRLDFDVVYTFRKRVKKYPLNGGFVVARVTEASTQFFNAVFEAYSRLPKENLSWWGDQIGVWDLVSPHVDVLREGVIDVRGTKLLLLDGDQHNWTPFDFDTSSETLNRNLFLTRSLLGEAEHKTLVHFKGPRKHLQFQFHKLLSQSGSVRASFAQFRSAPQALGRVCELRFDAGRWYRRHGGSPEDLESISSSDAVDLAVSHELVNLELSAKVSEPPPSTVFQPGGEQINSVGTVRWYGMSTQGISRNRLSLPSAKSLLWNTGHSIAALSVGFLPRVATIPGAIFELAKRSAVSERMTPAVVLLLACTKLDVEWRLSVEDVLFADSREMSIFDLITTLSASESSLLTRYLTLRLASQSGFAVSGLSKVEGGWGGIAMGSPATPVADLCDLSLLLLIQERIQIDLGAEMSQSTSTLFTLAKKVLTHFADFRLKVVTGEPIKVTQV